MEKEFLSLFQNLKVLIVEDNSSQRDKLKEVISLFTENIIVAADGIEALALYNTCFPNLIISDIKMPKLDGLEFAKKIREIDSKIPIIILTAHTDKDFLLKSVSLHLVNYLEKPIVQEKLIESLKSAADIIVENSLLEVKLQDGYTYNMIDKCTYKDCEKIKLTKKETLFMEYLLKHKNKVIEKDEVEQLLWCDSTMTKAALKNFIFKLRKKIGYDSIQTLSSNGFSLHLDT